MNDLLATALGTARSQVGVREEPPGSNCGPEVNVYLKSVGLSPGHPWCAAFVYWCFGQAAQKVGVVNPLVKTGHCLTHWQKAPQAVKITAGAARLDPSLVRPGLIGILLMDRRNGAGHAFIVEAIKDRQLTTIEGNTNQALSREGLAVCRLSRRSLGDGLLVGFLDYSRLSDE